MNFKAFALASSLALGTLFGSVGPAEAGTCWFLKGGQTSTGEWCQVDRRVNANGGWTQAFQGGVQNDAAQVVVPVK